MSFYAFKGFKHDLSCRGFQYEIGKTYVFDGPPIKCLQGFHYCTSLRDVFVYYPRYTYITNYQAWYDNHFNLCRIPNRYCIVEVLGDVDDNQSTSYEDTKGVTNKIRIVKELSQDEIDDLLNKSELSIHTYLFTFKEEVSDGKR